MPRPNTAYRGPKLDQNVQRDAAVFEHLRSAGWTVIRKWKHVPLEAEAEQVTSAVRRKPT